jgi:hypothetical protein
MFRELQWRWDRVTKSWLAFVDGIELRVKFTPGAYGQGGSWRPSAKAGDVLLERGGRGYAGGPNGMAAAQATAVLFAGQLRGKSTR